MISKGICFDMDSFPMHTAGERQFRVSAQTGELFKGRIPFARFGHPAPLIRHGLNHPIEFYCVTLSEPGILIALSDDRQTRYYWITPSGRRYPYVVDSPSHSFEQAWDSLFVNLLLDDRQYAIGLYNRISHIFIEYIKEKEKPVQVAVDGHWNRERVMAVLEWDESMGDRAVQVTLSDRAPVQVPLADHPLAALLRK
jgi:hypothetical protein